MTAQISDTFIFRGDKYSLIGIKGGGLITPEVFGMKPLMIHTACYRGYYATYELTNKALYLRELTLNEANQNYLPIEGIRPTKGESESAYTYHDLNVVVPFTGKIRLAKDFIEKLYVHMGYQKPTAFKTVLDITLKKGQTVDINDRSQEVRQKQGAFKKRYESADVTSNDIKDAFSLDMDLDLE
jgi:hypothetical protein